MNRLLNGHRQTHVDEGGETWVHLKHPNRDLVWALAVFSLAAWKVIDLIIWALSHVRIV